MQDNKQRTTPDSFFSHTRVSSKNARSNSFKEDLRSELAALYVDNISKGEQSPSSMSLRTFLMSKPFLGLTAAIALVVAAAAILLNPALNPQAPDESVQAGLGAEIIFPEGTVEYKTDQGGFAADGSVQLSEGASVRTLGSSRTIINLDDGSAVRLNYDTEITLVSLDPNDIDIELASGAVYTRVAKLDREFEVLTDSARYLSLGTAYKTTTSEDFESVTVYESKVEVTAEDEKLVVGQGKAYNTKAKKEQLDKKLYDVSSDRIKKDTFALWNRDFDVEFVEDKEDLGVFKDLTAPELTVTSHKNNQQVTKAEVTLKGKTEAGVKVTVNGNEVANNNGSFSKKVSLKVGKNTFNIKAIDDSGNFTKKSIIITRKQEATQNEQPSGNQGDTGSTQGSISLSGSQVNNGVKLTWSVANMEVGDGFKVLKSNSPNPTYPNNSISYIGDSSARSTTVNITNGATYYYRLCRYNPAAGGCDVYSNTVQVTAPDNQPVSTVNSISLSSSGGASLSWSYTGTVQQGFKVLWSKTNTAPNYPPGSGVQAYYTNGTSKTINAFDGAGTYYVRICEYLDGTCGTYSNTITVDL